MLQSLESIRDPVETDQRRTISIVSRSVRQVSKLLTKVARDWPGEAGGCDTHAARSGHGTRGLALCYKLLLACRQAWAGIGCHPHLSVMGRFLRAQGFVKRGQHALSARPTRVCREVSAPPCQPSKSMVRVCLEKRRSLVGARCRASMTRSGQSCPVNVPNRNRMTDVTRERLRAYSSH